MLTPLDFHYLARELKILERCNLKRIYKSDNIIFEFKTKKGILYFVAGKNFCYLDLEKPQETETKGFINFLSEKLKGKKLIKIEQDKFNKILVLDFSDYQLVLEFIGKGNIILCQEGKIVGCLFQREFKDRKIRVGEKYTDIKSEDIENYSEIKDKESLKKIHVGKIYTEEILKNLNLFQYRNTIPFDLSGGEKKRVALASVLCLNPDILILDEPTIGQDSQQKKYLINLIDDLRDQGKTIIIITHDIEFASEYIPRIIVMGNGRIIADGPSNIITNNEFILERTNLILPQLSVLTKILKSSDKFKDFNGDQTDILNYYNELRRYI